MKITGERLTVNAGMYLQLETEHLHRYKAVSNYVKGKVLDASCGTGYGSALLGENSELVIGVDIDSSAISYAKENFSKENIKFKTMSVTDMAFNKEFDFVVSFETLEHLSIEQQEVFIQNIKKALKNDGVLYISTPDKEICTNVIANGVENPYHKKEFYHDEFLIFLKKYFNNVELFYQNLLEVSVISNNNVLKDVNTTFSDKQDNVGKYLIAVCSDEEIERYSINGFFVPNINEYYVDKYFTETSSLYINIGRGFNEEDKILKRVIIDKEGNFNVKFGIEEFNNIEEIRFDPCERASKIEITGIKSNISGIALTPKNQFIQEDNKDVFIHHDPFYYIESSRLNEIKFIEISGIIKKISENEIDEYYYDKLNKVKLSETNLLNENETLQLDKHTLEQANQVLINENNQLKSKVQDTLDENESLKNKYYSMETEYYNINKEIERLNNVIIEYQRHSTNLKTKLDEYKNNLVLSNKVIEDYQNSLCWAITKPIRIVGDILKTLSNKEFWLKKLKKLYNKLPVRQKTKNKMKDCFFKAFSPILKSTEVYRVWKNQRYPILDRDYENENSEISSNYLDQILNIPLERGNSKNYVKKAGSEVLLTEDDIKYIAFYLPQFHPIPENDEWWGKGFTEWTNVTKAIPLFEGHYQPRLAGELGYYDLRMKQKINEQIQLAKFYGIYGFCIYYYWFDGKRLLETPLNIIIDNPELNLPFCLCWANENWSRRWDGKDQDILIQQNYNEEFPVRFIKDIAFYMKDNRYIKVNGKPVLIIYNANEIPDLKNVLILWRNYCRKIGLGEIYILAVDFALNKATETAGFDGFIEFPPHSIHEYSMSNINNNIKFATENFNGLIYDYNQIVKEKKYLDNKKNYFKGIFLGWDNTARKGINATIFHNFNIKSFKEWLTDITQSTLRQNNKDKRIVFINAWNEWAEGTYLEPDRHFGYAALDAVRDVIRNSRDKQKKIIYVSHDACFNGAQMLSLNLIKQLRDRFHFDVYVILKNSGELEEEFKKIAKECVCISTDFKNRNDFIDWVKGINVKIAMCNTVVTGDILKILSKCCVQCISMIHEMENVIKQYSCEENLKHIAEYAKYIIFASEYVRKSANKIVNLPEEKEKIMPQGLYMVNTCLDKKEKHRIDIRRKFNLNDKCKIVLGVGYGYHRKGTDLFIKTALNVCEREKNIAFLWVGDLDNDMQIIANKLLKNFEAKNRIIFAGNQKELMKYYVAADLFLLTSREDPFPSVVMEAMYASLPVIAFEDGGGYVEIVNDETGKLVPMEDYNQMSEWVINILNDNKLLKQKGKNAYNYVSEKCNFINYVYGLLSLLGEDYAKVSVIVPNYNYKNYLKERIDSIINQTYPIYEIILLDDNSNDNSVEILKEYVKTNPLQFKLIINEINSGNVFKQWEKGLNKCNGDYIWIAEADDLSEKLFLETLISKMIDNKDIVLGYTQSKMIDKDGNIIGNDYLIYTNDIDKLIWRNDYIINSEEEIKSHLSIKNTIPNVSGVVFKKPKTYSEILQKSQKFKVAGDWMFYVALLENGGKVLFISESLNKHRRHNNSVTKDLKAQIHYDEICKMQNYVADVYFNGSIQHKALDYRKKVKIDLHL